MKIRFTGVGTKDVEPVLGAVCKALQDELEGLCQGVNISQALDEIAVIVSVVDEEPERLYCRCVTPVSLSSNQNLVTGEKATLLTLRLFIPATFVLQNDPAAIAARVGSELISVISAIRTPRILALFDRGHLLELLHSTSDKLPTRRNNPN